jgi:ribosome-associated toxin RatA of RatAB toxin-antitoxin module
MEMTTRIQMSADRDTIFELAAAVEAWPQILPHYRWVRLLRDDGQRRVVAMAASRDGLPVRWTAIQVVDRADRCIRFRHIRGVTRGMEVVWTLTPNDQGVLVEIWHAFHPHWPFVPDVLVSLVVGRFFVDNIASKTLRRIKALAEERPRQGASVR